jgi:hypothetical protein
MQRVVQPITAGIAGKDPTGSITTVSRWCQPNDQEPRTRVTEARDWPTPVFLPSELALPKSRNLGAMSPQPGTELACGYEAGQPGKGAVGQGQQIWVLVGEAQEQAFGAARGLGFYLGEDGKVGGTVGTTGVGYQSPDFDRQPRLR